MFVMMKSKALAQSQNDDGLRKMLLTLIHTLTHPGFFKKKEKVKIEPKLIKVKHKVV